MSRAAAQGLALFGDSSGQHFAPRFWREASGSGRVTDSLGEGAGALAGYIDEAVVGGNLVEEGEKALGFGEDTFGEIGVELEESVVDAEAIVFDAALKDFDELLLTGQAFADLEKVGGRGVYGVVEGYFVGFGAAFPAERFFAKVGDLAVDVEIDMVEVI